MRSSCGELPVEEVCHGRRRRQDLEEAKAILKEIVDPPPDPKREQVEIWEAWFDRMADADQPVHLTPKEGAGEGPFPIDLSPSEAVPPWIPPRRKWLSFRVRL